MIYNVAMKEFSSARATPTVQYTKCIEVRCLVGRLGDHLGGGGSVLADSAAAVVAGSVLASVAVARVARVGAAVAGELVQHQQVGHVGRESLTGHGHHGEDAAVAVLHLRQAPELVQVSRRDDASGSQGEHLVEGGVGATSELVEGPQVAELAAELSLAGEHDEGKEVTVAGTRVLELVNQEVVGQVSGASSASQAAVEGEQGEHIAEAAVAGAVVAGELVQQQQLVDVGGASGAGQSTAEGEEGEHVTEARAVAVAVAGEGVHQEQALEVQLGGGSDDHGGNGNDFHGEKRRL